MLAEYTLVPAIFFLRLLSWIIRPHVMNKKNNTINLNCVVFSSWQVIAFAYAYPVQESEIKRFLCISKSYNQLRKGFQFISLLDDIYLRKLGFLRVLLLALRTKEEIYVPHLVTSSYPYAVLAVLRYLEGCGRIHYYDDGLFGFLYSTVVRASTESSNISRYLTWQRNVFPCIDKNAEQTFSYRQVIGQLWSRYREQPFFKVLSETGPLKHIILESTGLCVPDVIDSVLVNNGTDHAIVFPHYQQSKNHPILLESFKSFRPVLPEVCIVLLLEYMPVVLYSGLSSSVLNIIELMSVTKPIYPLKINLCFGSRHLSSAEAEFQQLVRQYAAKFSDPLITLIG